MSTYLIILLTIILYFDYNWIKFRGFDMNITFSDEEINQFPVEMKEFIVGYVKQRMEATEQEEPMGARWDDDSPEGRKAAYLMSPTSNEIFYCVEHDNTMVSPTEDRAVNPKKYKYPELELISNSKFDWFKAFNIAGHFTPDSIGDHLEYTFDLNGDILELHPGGISDGVWLIDSKEVNIPVLHLFLCLFGFGGILKDMRPATTPKEFIDNLRLSGCNIKNYRSSGPYLKSLTTFIREKMLTDGYDIGPGVSDKGFFDIKKSTNEFYFRGSTRDDCLNACKRIISDLSNVSLDELGENKYKLVAFSDHL